MDTNLPHERLDAYRVALELAHVAAKTTGPRDLVDQLRRATASVALNIAEGSGKTGADRRRYYLIARGSALECAAALDVLCAFGGARSDAKGLCVRLYAMLTRMAGVNGAR